MDIYIVVPVFNEQAFVEQSLTSLLNQTYAPKQLVVVDDGSTDNTVTIIRKLADTYPNVKLIKSDDASAHGAIKSEVHALTSRFPIYQD